MGAVAAEMALRSIHITVAAVEQGQDEVYLPWFWGWIMRVIRHIPERLFKGLRL